MKLKRDELLLKLGAAKNEAGRAYHLVDIHIPEPREATQTFILPSTAPNCVRCGGAKAATCYAATSATRIPKNSGNSTCNSAMSKKPSKTSRAT